MRIYELDDQSGKFGCRTTKFNFQTELFKQMSDNGNPFKIYYDRLQLRETRFIVPHADVQGTDMCVCSQTPPRPMDGFTSYLVERCTSYPDNTWTTFHDLGSKVKVTMGVKVTVANTLKNQLCATYSCNSSFWRSCRVEQILYKNLWSKMNIFHTNRVFRTSTVR